MLLATIGGVSYGVKALLDKKARDREAAAARIKAFDASGYTIESGAFKLSDGTVVRVSQADFRRIPAYHTGGSLQSPRKIKIDEETCETVPTHVAVESKVHIVASETDPFQAEPLAVTRNRKGELVVCSLQAFDDSEENTREIAIQLR